MTGTSTAQKKPEALELYRDLVGDEWEKIAGRISADLKRQLTPDIAEVFSSYISNPGKLVRPSLFLLGFSSYSVNPPSDWTTRLSISFELLHTYLLIQDDIMDASPMRRGKPSLHVMLEKHHMDNGMVGDPKLFGTNVAILLSDIMANHAESIWTDRVNEGRVDPLLRSYFDEMKQSVYCGQFFDLLAPAEGKSPDPKLILKIMIEKSAKYSVYYPLLLGFLAGGAKLSELNWLTQYSINLGIVFQITDDLLGVFGDPAITGKPNISDIEERKHTFLYHLAYKNSDRSDREKLLLYFSGRNDSSREALSIIKKQNVYDETLKLAEKYAIESQEALYLSDLDQSKKELLFGLISSILRRQR